MPLITTISDELVALELGSVVARGEPQAVVNDPRVVETYLGGAEAAINRSGARTPAAPRRRRSPLVAAGR
jgi:ABC-type hemin transport system ATPase subunit